MRSTRTLLAAAALAATLPAYSAPLLINFEGVGDLNPVGNTYLPQGVSFSSNAVAVVDSDAGGSGDFANEPSGDTALVILNGPATINVASGFTTGFSFWYTAVAPASVSLYDGADGTGSLIGTIGLDPQPPAAGDPTGGEGGTWALGSLAFNGTARSIVFGGEPELALYDNVTFDNIITRPPIPEPSTYALMALGLAGLGLARRRRA